MHAFESMWTVIMIPGNVCLIPSNTPIYYSFHKSRLIIFVHYHSTRARFTISETRIVNIVLEHYVKFIVFLYGKCTFFAKML